MDIDFSVLNVSFSQKPLIIGGKAMEYYGLREAGNDIDIVICKEDFVKLALSHPHSLKNIWGDLGVVIGTFECWKTIQCLNYQELIQDVIQENDYAVLSLEKLLLQKVQVKNDPKSEKDVALIAKKINEINYKNFDQLLKENEQILNTITDYSFLEEVLPS